MQRDPRAYLKDVVDPCDAIVAAVGGLDRAQYRTNRLVRSAVEREFIIIGEAIAALRRHAPTAFGRITDGTRIVDFRNQLTHEHVHVNDAVAWGVIEHNVAALRNECALLLSEMNRDADRL
jgi:uncharacterized protein with HEPN domain